jgi:hypothetical protein
LGSLGFSLDSIWVRFFKIINNDGQSLASFFQKIFLAELERLGTDTMPGDEYLQNGGSFQVDRWGAGQIVAPPVDNR